MMPEARRRAPWLLALVALVAGCSPLSRPYPVKQRWMLHAERPDPQPPRAGAPVLEVRAFAVSPRLDGRRLVYRTGDSSYVADFYNEIWAPPGALVASETADWLAGAGLFSAIVPASAAGGQGLALEGWIADLYGDSRDRAHPIAVMELHVVLRDGRSADARILGERRYREEAPAAAPTPEALVAAYDALLAKILGELEADLRRLVTQ